MKSLLFMWWRREQYIAQWIGAKLFIFLFGFEAHHLSVAASTSILAESMGPCAIVLLYRYATPFTGQRSGVHPTTQPCMVSATIFRSGSFSYLVAVVNKTCDVRFIISMLAAVFHVRYLTASLRVHLFKAIIKSIVEPPD